MFVKNGYTLVEWLISFFLVIFVVTLLFQFSTHVNSKLAAISKKSNLFTEVFAAVDAVTRKLYCAPCQTKFWKDLRKDSLVWHDPIEKKDFGWLFQKNQLFFVTGTFSNALWKRKRKNLVARNIESWKFIPHKKAERITAIDCEVLMRISNKEYRCKRRIGLRNRCFS